MIKKLLAGLSLLTLFVAPVFAQDQGAPAAPAAPAVDAPAPTAKKAKTKKGGDEEGIKKAFDSFSEAWASADAAKIASFWVPEGSFINPMGVEAHNRKEIEQVVGADLQMMKGTAQNFSDYTIEFVLPNLALVDVTTTLTGMKNADGTDAEPGKFHIYAVVVNRGKAWQARALRVMAFMKPPSEAPAAASAMDSATPTAKSDSMDKMEMQKK